EAAATDQALLSRAEAPAAARASGPGRPRAKNAAVDQVAHLSAVRRSIVFMWRSLPPPHARLCATAAASMPARRVRAGQSGRGTVYRRFGGNFSSSLPASFDRFLERDGVLVSRSR